MEVIDGRGQRRKLVLMALTSEFTFRGDKLWQLFLENLSNITFTGKDGQQDHLANHLVAGVMTYANGSIASCKEASKQYGVRCFKIPAKVFHADNYHYKSLAFFGLSFAKVASVLNTLSTGTDVLFLDCDQVLFRNPLPYVLSRDAHLVVTGDCYARNDSVLMGAIPPWKSNIGFLYTRATPTLTAFAAAWLANLVYTADLLNPELDQNNFPFVFDHFKPPVYTLKELSAVMLQSEFFPHRCDGACGCNATGVGAWERGRTPKLGADGRCAKDMVRQWYGYHVPCSGTMNDKVKYLREYLDMYEDAVGPVNTLSEKTFRVVG
ncbi:hypothetical protein HYH03_012843 [Edaphochlamys debaryana]|uniref:Nucleotide-diphospho-sugar transferase domain-containing protein n=1 Tax=Edaphochlamys debaryana TaxID=47281 RepID=A0A835XQR4_9CHLO|nr:hypothetical protein HYH03_012843 [Edaphochlamys debaryana]|eukprot:KAG2488523.1 hypothetical protein HYH03_012843 [Edaphochlamys debaryana]